jgi:hypothetical protein
VNFNLGTIATVLLVLVLFFGLLWLLGVRFDLNATDMIVVEG